MMTVLVPLLMVVAGLLILALTTKPESNAALKEFGRAMMWAGLFAVAFALAGRAVHLF
jgi:predicted membrane protein